jgi:transposase
VAINQLKALIVGASDELRADLRGAATAAQLAPLRRAAGPASPATGAPHDGPGAPHHRPADPTLQAEIDELTTQLTNLVDAIAPWLTDLPGIGPVTAAQVLVSWSSAGRLRLRGGIRGPRRGQSDPPASSGQVTRHRPNRSRGRQPGPRLHTIVHARLRDDPTTRAYLTRRVAEGKTPPEIRRCLKRFVARQLFKLLERCDQPGIETLPTA